MLIYLAVIFISFLLALLYCKVQKNDKKYVFFLLLIIPVVVSGLRGVGTDYFLYQDRFELLANNTYDISSFSLIYILMKILIRVGLGYQVFTFVISFLTVYIAFWLICKYEKVISVPVAFFSYITMYYQMSFNTFRQILSAELFLMACYYLFERENKKLYWIFLAIAVLIHTTTVIFGVIFFVLPLLIKKRYRAVRGIIYLVAVVTIMAMPLMAESLSKFANIFPHYTYYLINFAYTGSGLGLIRYLLTCILPIGMIIFMPNMFQKEFYKKFQPYIVLCVMGTILYMLSLVSTSVAFRFAYTGMISLPLVHGYFAKNCKKKPLNILVLICICVVLLAFWWYDFIHLNRGETYPYVFFWM
ncbi:MAG: EpsG family protein [Agathobacter sp.]